MKKIMKLPKVLEDLGVLVVFSFEMAILS
jgi:hypothetical protein